MGNLLCHPYSCMVFLVFSSSSYSVVNFDFVNFGFVNFDFVNFAHFLLLNFAHFLLLKFKIRIASSYILAHTHTASRINSTQNRQIVRSSVPRTPQVFQLFLEISPVAEFHFYCRCAACLFASLSYFDSWINTSYITII